MTLPYENATSGGAALEDIRKLLTRFGCARFGTTPPMNRAPASVRFKSWADARRNTMKTVYGKVRCQYWNQSDDICAEVEDDASPEQIEAALREVAIEQAGFEFWEIDAPNDQGNRAA